MDSRFSGAATEFKGATAGLLSKVCSLLAFWHPAVVMQLLTMPGHQCQQTATLYRVHVREMTIPRKSLGD